MPTTRVLQKQKRPVKKQGRKQRLDFRENPINGIPWANQIDFLLAVDPTIGSAAPSTVLASAPATLITITGTGFGPGSVVEVDQIGQPTTFVSTTTLTFMFDPTVAGTVQITVRNTTGKESGNLAFVVGAGVVEDPQQSWSKPQIIAWLVARGVVVDERAAQHFSKPELLAIVAAYLNDDPELDDLLNG